MSQEAANNSNNSTAAASTSNNWNWNWNWNSNSNSVSYPSLEGTEGHGHPRPQSLHDFFQFLSHVPLYAAADPPVPTPVSPHLDAPSTSLFFDFDDTRLGPTHSIAPLDHQGTEVKDVDLKGKHKLIEPHGLRDSAGVGLKVDDMDIRKGWATISNAKGKQPLDPNETHKLYQKSRRSSQKRSSEHRRRERINERMKALRALIPHCYKGDYSSILDHAIDYIKSLKLQIDVMSRSMGERHLVQDPCAIQTMNGARMPPALFGIGASSVPWSWEFQLFPRYPPPLVHPVFQTPAQMQTQTQTQAHLPLAPFLYTRPLHGPETQSRPNPTLLSSFIRPATTTYDQAPPYFHPPTST